MEFRLLGHIHHYLLVLNERGEHLKTVRAAADAEFKKVDNITTTEYWGSSDDGYAGWHTQ